MKYAKRFLYTHLYEKKDLKTESTRSVYIKQNTKFRSQINPKG